MSRHASDEGIILKKQSLLNNSLRITLFTKSRGKLSLAAYGIKKITSRRLSHLETGNFIRFSYYTKEGYSSLRETELIYGYSKIKESPEKLDALYLIIFILNKILPEDQEEYEIYTMTHKILKELNNRETTMKDVEKFVMSLLEKSGFIDEKIKSDKSFDAISFVEELIGQKIRIT